MKIVIFREEMMNIDGWIRIVLLWIYNKATTLHKTFNEWIRVKTQESISTGRVCFFSSLEILGLAPNY